MHKFIKRPLLINSRKVITHIKVCLYGTCIWGNTQRFEMLVLTKKIVTLWNMYHTHALSYFILNGGVYFIQYNQENRLQG